MCLRSKYLDYTPIPFVSCLYESPAVVHFYHRDSLWWRCVPAGGPLRGGAWLLEPLQSSASALDWRLPLSSRNKLIKRGAGKENKKDYKSRLGCAWTREQSCWRFLEDIRSDIQREEWKQLGNKNSSGIKTGSFFLYLCTGQVHGRRLVCVSV